RVKALQHNKAIPLLANCTELFSISDTYNVIMHPTKSVAIENEMGSVGPMDATIYPLLKFIQITDARVLVLVYSLNMTEVLLLVLVGYSSIKYLTNTFGMNKERL